MDNCGCGKKVFLQWLSIFRKNETRSNNVGVPTDVVLKLMDPLFKKGCNVTCDNYFTSLPLSLKLAQNNCSLLGTIRHNQKEIPNILKTKQKLHGTVIVKSKENIMTITSYQCKKSKSVNILSTLHPSVSIPEENYPKKKPESVLFYKKTKFELDVLDQMTRIYLVKAASKRWPIHVFYNIIGLALINSWIVYKNVCKSSISRRNYMQKISEELTGNVPNRTQTENREANIQFPPAKCRRTCSIRQCKNRTTDVCDNCIKPVC